MTLSLTVFLAICSSCKARFQNVDSYQSSRSPLSRSLQDCAADPDKLPLVITADPYTAQPITRYWGLLGRQRFTSPSKKNYVIEMRGSFVEKGHPKAIANSLEMLRRDDSDAANQLLKQGEQTLQFEAKALCQSFAYQVISDQVSSLLNFVFGIYEDRKEFDKKMIDNLIMQSMGVLRSSIYVAIREADSQTGTRDSAAENSRIVAVVRIARAPYGRRYVVRADEHGSPDPIEDESGDFGPLFRTMVPELWSGHAGAYGSPLEGKENFPDFDPTRAAYIRDYTRPRDPKEPLKYLTTEQISRGVTAQTIKRSEFRSLPLEQSLRIKLPRESPGQKSSSDSEQETKQRRASETDRRTRFNVYYSSGELMEIGSYAIKKGYSEDVRLQFYAEFARLIREATKDHHVRLWNRSNAPRLYTLMGFREVGPKVENEYGNWTLQTAQPEDLLQALGTMVAKMSQGSLTSEERNAVLAEVDGWVDKEWRAQSAGNP